MLTKEAFNALLKTLEEPPAKVKFLFATTELHKVPPTILSRCQRFNLDRISSEIAHRVFSEGKDITFFIEGLIEYLCQILLVKMAGIH